MTFDLSALGLTLAFGGGLVSFLSPCVLPLVPGYVAWVAGAGLAEAEARRARAVAMAGCFVLGFGLVFVLLGLGATAIGAALHRWSAELQVAGGVLIGLMGLVQAGMLRPIALMRDLRFRLPIGGGGPTSAVLIGAAFGFGWTPCIGPVLAGVLAAAALTPGAGAGLLAAYAAGLGVPFLLTAFYLPEVTSRLRRLGRAGRIAQFVSGLLMALMGALIATGEITVLAGWMLVAFPWLARIG